MTACAQSSGVYSGVSLPTKTRQRFDDLPQRQLPRIRAVLHGQLQIVVPRQFHRQSGMNFIDGKPHDKCRAQRMAATRDKPPLGVRAWTDLNQPVLSVVNLVPRQSGLFNAVNGQTMFVAMQQWGLEIQRNRASHKLVTGAYQPVGPGIPQWDAGGSTLFCGNFQILQPAKHLFALIAQ